MITKTASETEKCMLQVEPRRAVISPSLLKVMKEEQGHI